MIKVWIKYRRVGQSPRKYLKHSLTLDLTGWFIIKCVSGHDWYIHDYTQPMASW